MPDKRQYNTIFKEFVGRDEDLRRIKRYSYYKMLYRSNVLTHAHRVAAITRALNPLAVNIFGTKYNPKKAELMALVHDDPEIIIGDILAGNKSKMSPQELKTLKQTETDAINEISTRYPKYVAGYSYKSLLLEAEQHESLESQVVQYADKFDALGEALHEMHAGNWHFITNVTNHYGLIPTPIEYYYEYFCNYAKNYPNMKPLLANGSPLFTLVNKPNSYIKVVKNGRPHTTDSINKPTGDICYDQWLKITKNCANLETVKDLYTQKEYL